MNKNEEFSDEDEDEMGKVMRYSGQYINVEEENFIYTS